jgi:hypothetical protein
MRNPSRIGSLLHKLPKSKTLDRITPVPKKPADQRSMSLLDDLSNNELVKLTGAHITSVRRWRRLKAMPVHVSRLLEFVALNKLDGLGWVGWKLKNGKLISPDGLEVSPGEVQAIQLRQQQLAHYQANERKWKAVPEQPLPSTDAAAVMGKLKRA